MTQSALDFPDISVVLTAHAEGLLSGVSAQSAEAAMRVAEDHGLRCELVVVLDRADAVTRSTLDAYFEDGESGLATVRLLYTDEGDPGKSRNRGVAVACGRHVAFLDADDLWSENWLVFAHRLLCERPDVIAHSACNIIFGDESLLWWHVDSESPLFDPKCLDWMNCWDALAFARTELLRQYPFAANDLKLGFGHEDWHWNQVTLRSGVPHKPVPETIHFKRRREGSQSDLVNQKGGLPWPLPTLRNRTRCSDPASGGSGRG